MSTRDGGRRLGRTDTGHADRLLACPPEPGIAHLGLGNFHRAHLAVYTAEAVAAGDPGAWGIRAHSMFDASVVDAIRSQDGLYSCTFADTEGSRAVVPGVHTAVAGPEQSPELAQRWIADPRTRIVSVTITERGYLTRPGERALDVADPDVVHDVRTLGAAVPRTALGQLANGLLRRHRSGGDPVTIMSCDNVPANSRLLATVLHQFVDGCDVPGRNAFLRWLDSEVAFCCTMVDRIVPRPDDRLREHAQSVLGVTDDAALVVEPFGQFVIEDGFAAGRPAWDAAGAQFSSEVDRHEELKLTVLNGSHLLLAYGGLLAGVATIPEAASDRRLAERVRRMVSDEMRPVLTLPTGVELDDYVGTLFRRWDNRVLADPLRRVGELGWLKLPPRVGHVLEHHLRRGRVPVEVVEVLADYAACVLLGKVEAPISWRTAGTGVPAVDQCVADVLDLFSEVWAAVPDGRARVEAPLADGLRLRLTTIDRRR